MAPVTIVNEPRVVATVLLLAIVPPVPAKPAAARLNVLRSNMPPLTVSRPVPIAPLLIASVAPLPMVADETPGKSVPPVTVVPPLYVFAAAGFTCAIAHWHYPWLRTR